MKKWLLLLLLVASPAFAQVLQHPEKVEIKPPVAGRTGDALRVFGGITAGADGNTLIVAPDGTLAVGGLPPASITFGMWDDNGCANNEIPKYNGAAWVCAVDGGGSVDPTAALTITGLWRFQNGALFGDATTLNQLVHVYKATAQAGVRIEQGNSGGWDLLAINGGKFTIGEKSASTLLTMTSNRVGVLQGSPGYTLDVNGDVHLSGDFYPGSYIGGDLIPRLSDTYNLGSYNRLWGQGFVSQLNALVFAEQTIQLAGGYIIVPKNAGNLDSAAPATATDTDVEIDLGKNIGTNQWILFRGYDASGVIKAEYALAKTIKGGTTSTYYVNRDLAGWHATNPQWPIGTPFMVIGQAGDGRIELYAYDGSTRVPKIGVVQQGATYGAISELVRLGGLDGMPGMASFPGRYGLFIGTGATASDAFLKYQKTSGTPSGDDDKLVVQGTIRALEGWFGNSSGISVINGGGLEVAQSGYVRSNGASAFMSGSSGFWMGYDTSAYKFRVGDPVGGRITWDGSTMNVVGSITVTGGNAATTTYVDTGLGGKINTGGAATDVNNNVTTISGGKITTGSITADRIVANSITSSQLATDLTVSNVVRSSGLNCTGTSCTGSGFYMNGSTTVAKFGSDTAYLMWDGSNVVLRGNLVYGVTSGNLLPNASWRTSIKGWSKGYANWDVAGNNCGWGFGHAGTDFPTWVPTSENGAYSVVSGASCTYVNNGIITIEQDALIPVETGKRYEASVYTGDHRSNGSMVGFVWYDTNGTYVGETWSDGTTTGGTINASSGLVGAGAFTYGGKDIDSFNRAWVIATPPSNAVTFRFSVRQLMRSATTGSSGIYLFLTRAYVGRAGEGQTIPSPWVPGTTNTDRVENLATSLGSITLDTYGSLSTSGTTWASGTGLWMGWNGSAYVFRVGTTNGSRLMWDGDNVELIGSGVSIDSNDNLVQLYNTSWGDGGFFLRPGTHANGMEQWNNDTAINGDGSTYLFRSGSFMPYNGNARDLGGSSNTWNELYLEPSTTTGAHYPLVLYNGNQVVSKTNGVNTAVTVVTGVTCGGDPVDCYETSCNLYFQYGILVTGGSGACIP